MNPSIKHKYIFYFYKRGWFIFISHLNLMRLFERAFKRSGLPVVYSQGFNPHMRLSLPFPLSLGYQGLQEIGEIYLEEKTNPEEFKERMNSYLPEDIKIITVENKNIKSLCQLIESYDYSVVFKSGFETSHLKKYLQQKELIVEKTSKKGRVNRLNLFEYLKSYNLEKNKFSFTLFVKEQKTIDIDQMLKVLEIKTEDIEDIVREKINCAAV